MAVNWQLVSDRASAELLAQQIIAVGRLILGETAIDRALRFAMAEISTNDYSGRRRVIDLSGDGATNWGGLPDEARDEAVAAGITINALAIVNEQPDLDRYFQDHVIGGVGAFVVRATDYEDFARAIRFKLIEEIQGRPAAGLSPSLWPSLVNSLCVGEDQAHSSRKHVMAGLDPAISIRRFAGQARE